jgi:hypothetical protein
MSVETFKPLKPLKPLKPIKPLKPVKPPLSSKNFPSLMTFFSFPRYPFAAEQS